MDAGGVRERRGTEAAGAEWSAVKWARVRGE